MLKPAPRWVLILLLAVGLGLLLWALSHLAASQAFFALDWSNFWKSSHGLRIDYSSSHSVHPPWIIALVWPLTLWRFPFSWSLSLLLTLAVLAFSVPRGESASRWAGGLLLLVLSYPALRQLTDFNFEALLIGGVLLILWALQRQSIWGLAVSLVLLSAKVQQSWLLVLVAAWWVWRHWPRRAALSGLGMALVWMLPFALWRGADWWQRLADFAFFGAPHDMSLRATLLRGGGVARSGLGGLGACTGPQFVAGFPTDSTSDAHRSRLAGGIRTAAGALSRIYQYGHASGNRPDPAGPETASPWLAPS